MKERYRAQNLFVVHIVRNTPSWTIGTFTIVWLNPIVQIKIKMQNDNSIVVNKITLIPLIRHNRHHHLHLYLISGRENDLIPLVNILLAPSRKIEVVVNNAYTTPHTRT